MTPYQMERQPRWSNMMATGSSAADLSRILLCEKLDTARRAKWHLHCRGGATSIPTSCTSARTRRFPSGTSYRPIPLTDSDNGGQDAAVLYRIMATLKRMRASRLPTCVTSWSSYHATRSAWPRRCCPTPGWRRTRKLAGAGRGNWSTKCCDAEKLHFADYSTFC